MLAAKIEELERVSCSGELRVAEATINDRFGASFFLVERERERYCTGRV